MPTALQDAEADFDSKDSALKAAVLDRKAARKVKDDAISAFDVTDNAVAEKKSALELARDAVTAAVNAETTAASEEPADPVPPPVEPPVEPPVQPPVEPVPVV